MNIDHIVYIITGILIILLSCITIFRISKKRNSNIFSRNVLIIILIIATGTLIYYFLNRDKEKEKCPPPPESKDVEWADLPKKDTMEILTSYQNLIGEKQMNSGEASESHVKCLKSQKVLNMLYYLLPTLNISLKDIARYHRDELSNPDEINPNETIAQANIQSLSDTYCYSNPI